LFCGPALPGIEIEEAQDKVEEEAAFLIFFEDVLGVETPAVGVGTDDVGEALVLEIFLGINDRGVGVARILLRRLECKDAAGGRGRRWWRYLLLVLLLLNRLQGRGKGVGFEQQPSRSLCTHPRAHSLLLRHEHRIRGCLFLPYLR
jgi:hypothetical protein